MSRPRDCLAVIARIAALVVALVTALSLGSLLLPVTGLAADPAAAEAQRMEAYWTGDRIRAATPRDLVVPASIGGGAGGGGARPASGGTTAHTPATVVSVGGAHWTNGGAILQRSGLVLFSISGQDFSCSGSVITDDNDPSYSLIITAGHCAYDLDTHQFVSNWTYIPAWDLTPAAGSCSQTTYGCWDARALVVHDGWSSGSGLTVTTLRHDYAIAVVGPVRGGSTQLDSLGAYPLRLSGVAAGDVLDAFGYPAEAPYDGSALVYCQGAAAVEPTVGSWGLDCDMTGGASGGPWLAATADPATATGEVASVSSYRQTGDPNLYGPVLDGSTRAVYDLAKGATPDAIGIDDLTATGVASVTPFTDIAGSTFLADIEWLYLKDITRGCAPTLFCPRASVTREQMAGFLVRAFALPASGKDFFTDDTGRTLEAEDNALRQAGITTGCAPGKYCPTAIVTREQMAGFLVRALGLSPTTTSNYFVDDETSTFEADINALRKAGITTGCDATHFCPKDKVSREQMAGFLHRALGG